MSGTGTITPVCSLYPNYRIPRKIGRFAIWPTRKQHSRLMTRDLAYESSSHSGAYEKKTAAKAFNWLTKLKEMTLKFP